MQPLDRTFFKSLKSAFNVACTLWLHRDSARRITVDKLGEPARRITVDKLGEMFAEAYLKSATVQNVVSGF